MDTRPRELSDLLRVPALVGTEPEPESRSRGVLPGVPASSATPVAVLRTFTFLRPVAESFPLFFWNSDVSSFNCGWAPFLQTPPLVFCLRPGHHNCSQASSQAFHIAEKLTCKLCFIPPLHSKLQRCPASVRLHFLLDFQDLVQPDLPLLESTDFPLLRMPLCFSETGLPVNSQGSYLHFCLIVLCCPSSSSWMTLSRHSIHSIFLP